MKDPFCSYYTNSPEICEWLTAKLEIRDGDIVLDPSAGDGALIDAVFASGKSVTIDALEKNPDAVSGLQRKYGERCDVAFHKRRRLTASHRSAGKPMSSGASQLVLKETDTLFDEDLDRFVREGGHYSKIIANPPYGAWQDPERREALKVRFPGYYVRETYSLFLLRALSLLKPGGRLSFIIPDTWLYLNFHCALRRTILSESAIDDVLIFPSNFFPGLSFGYSSLSMVTLTKCSPRAARESSFRVLKGFRTPTDFRRVLEADGGNASESAVSLGFPDYLAVYRVNQSDVLSHPRAQVMLGHASTQSLLKTPGLTLGDVAFVVTGLCTGDNRRFIRVKDASVPGGKAYEVVDRDRVRDALVKEEKSDGIEAPEVWIPYVKAAPKRPYTSADDRWFLRWDRETVNFYKTDKKARFQNPGFYFQTGLGIPMVKSKRIRAFLMNDRVFDQSIVGIFPKDPERKLYLLALMNSSVVNDLIHGLNPTANNSANYVKAIPYREPDDAMRLAIEAKVRALLEAEAAGDWATADAIYEALDREIEALYRGQEKTENLTRDL